MSAFQQIIDETRSNRPPDPTQASESLQGEALLRYYATEWDRYTKAANYINRLFTYLNRGWVKRERDEGRKSIYPVYTVCLSPYTHLSSGVHANRAMFFLSRNSDATEAVFGAMENQLLNPSPKQWFQTSRCHPPTHRAPEERRRDRRGTRQNSRTLFRVSASITTTSTESTWTCTKPTSRSSS